VPGKNLNTAATLSRAPVDTFEGKDQFFPTDVEAFVNAVMDNFLPATKQRLEPYKEAQEDDPVSQQVRLYCQQGWPTKNSVKPEISPYWNYKEFLTECKGLLMYGHRIKVPKSLQRETLKRIHKGHQGIELSGGNNIIGMVARCEYTDGTYGSAVS